MLADHMRTACLCLGGCATGALLVALLPHAPLQAGAAGLLLASLSAYWVRSCVARHPWRAAGAEAIWAACIVVGLGQSLGSFAAAIAFCVGTGLGTFWVVRRGA